MISSSATSLHDGFRHAMIATIDHPAGEVTIATTHLASGSDGANDPCGASCPTECAAAGATTNRQCQAVQLADVVEGLGGALVTGDFNAEPGSFEYDYLIGRGWVDTYLAAGNAECVPATGEGCTSGREDQDLADMEDPGLNQDERIDYIFDASFATGCALEASGDADGDGVATGGFAHRPNPFDADCGPAPLSLCWPSDHGGVAIDLNCDP